MSTESLVEDSFAITPTGVIRGNIGHPDITCWLEDEAEPSVAYISIKGREPQDISLVWDDITYGKRAYFECTCGLRVNKLYLPQKSKEFKCRKCHNLQYQLTTFNRNSVAGRALYQMNRMRKLSDSRASMGRILYDGNYTKKFERFLCLCERAGFNTIVQGAEDLRMLIKG